jgi:hypothetical protein
MIAHAHLKMQTACTETAVVDCEVALTLFQRLDKRKFVAQNGHSRKFYV